MNGLGIHIQRLIKKQRFNLNTTDSKSRWRTGKVNLDYRITWVNDEYWETKVNIMVKGIIEDKKIYTEGDPQFLPAIDVIKKTRENSWTNDYKKRSVIWGDQYHKQIRRFIRREVEQDLHRFLKLIGINERLTIDKVNFER